MAKMTAKEKGKSTYLRGKKKDYYNSFFKVVKHSQNKNL